MEDCLYIVMPVYNEEANIKKTIESWYPLTALGKDSKLLLIDDGSKDESVSIIEKMQETRPNLILIKKANSGHGPTVRLAYKEALDRGADYVFQPASDGQTLPEEFYLMWEAREAYRVQIGWRKSREDGFNRKLVSWVLRLVLLVFLGQKTKDPNTPFRLMSRDALALYLPLLPEDYNLPNALIAAYTNYTGLSHRYIPITFRPRQGGKNSINFKRIFSIGWGQLKTLPKMNKAMRAKLPRATRD